MGTEYDYLFKFIIVGESNVGKSCLLQRFLGTPFKSEHQPTLGVQFGSKICPIHSQNIKIQVWDTAGQQSFRSITRAYYRGSIAALLVFDLTSLTSFEAMQYWIKEVRMNSHNKLQICVVGNKCDLVSEREVSQAMVTKFLEGSGIDDYFETSALSGQNCGEPFLEMARRVVKSMEEGKILEDDWALGVKPHPNKILRGSPNGKKLGDGKEEKIGKHEKCNC